VAVAAILFRHCRNYKYSAVVFCVRVFVPKKKIVSSQCDTVSLPS